MDFTLYNLVISQLAEKPDLSIVQNRLPVPEEWPLVVENISTYRKHLEYFQVSDGQNSAMCFTAVPELQQKIVSMEIGTILHLIGAETRFDDDRKFYVVELQDVCTLKEYDDRLKDQEKAEAERRAWLKSQGYLEEMSYDPSASGETSGPSPRKP